MNLKDTMINALFGGIIDTRVAERLKAASISDVESGWRRLTGNSDRELLPTTQARMIEIAYWLWETNPMAGWLIDITVAFILGEGLPYEAKNDKVKQILDEFWYDPINRMDLYFPKHVTELLIFGELCLPAFTAAQTGKVRLGYIDPAMIVEAVPDPENVKVILGVVVSNRLDNGTRRLKTILPKDIDYVLSPKGRIVRDSFTDGECFFYAINNVTNSPRGRSELLSTADWLDAYEQFLYDYAEKWPQQNSFTWDLEVENGNEDDIKKHVNSFSKKSGSVFGHNDKVKLNAITPDLKSLDAEKGARLFRNHILGRKGFPEHWFGGGGDVNRATASEMGAPTLKMLTMKQRLVKYILEDIFGYAIEKRRTARTLYVTDEEAGQYSVITPDLSQEDITKFSTAIRDVSASLVIAEKQEWVDKDTARKLFALLSAFLGMEIDVKAVKEAVEKEKSAEGYEDYLGDTKEPNPASKEGEDE